MKDFFRKLDPANGLHKSDEGLFPSTRPGKCPSSDPMKDKMGEMGQGNVRHQSFEEQNPGRRSFPKSQGNRLFGAPFYLFIFV
ncbi:hypothetical protein ACIQ4Z_17485 [Peribacillus asahii]|uniref:hypothetical protein n=1 Tax=Peribacillus asahii TaxID=228899 RepID=UPI00382ED0AE